MTLEELLDFLNQPFKFWVCPNHPKGIVTWEGNKAVCKECGNSNS